MEGSMIIKIYYSTIFSLEIIKKINNEQAAKAYLPPQPAPCSALFPSYWHFQ